MKKKARNIHAGDTVSFTGKREDAARVSRVEIITTEAGLKTVLFVSGKPHVFCGNDKLKVYRKLR